MTLRARRASAWAAVRNQLKRTGHSLEFRPEERAGLVSDRIRRWIKRAFHYFALAIGSHKFHCEFNAELHCTDDAKSREWRNMTVPC